MRVRVRPFSRMRSSLAGRRFVYLLIPATLSIVLLTAHPAAAQDIALYSSDVTTIQGNWARVPSASGAGAQKMASTDVGWSSTNNPLAAPGDYFEANFTARAWIGYRVWLRLKAANNSKWNDSVWAQFSDALGANGNAIYRIGTTSGLLFNLEECTGCGVSNWGWSGGAWWVSQELAIQFPTDGTKTIRIQTREDGVEIDQIVISSASYMNGSPGRSKDDTTLLPRSGGGGSTPPPPAPAPPPPTSAKAIPGTIEAEDFDNGANGATYWDSSAGNSGGQYRSTDVDVEACSAGGYNVGWIASGEWLNYTVNVSAAGTYQLDFRVAAPSGGTLHVEFGGQDKTGAVTIPSTGGWQAWTTVSRTVTLSAGTQVMRVVFDTGGMNVNSIAASAAAAAPPPPPPSASLPFGGNAWTLPGTVQSEDFDQGGQGVSYYDNSPGNAGGAYRSTDVDIEATPTGGYAVGWAFAGEWLRYTVNVTAGANYRLVARVASAGSGGTFHVEFNGVDRTGALRVPNTGGWTTYQDVAVNVWLDSGTQPMRVVMDSNGATTAVGNLSYIRVETLTAAPPPPPPPPTAGGRLRMATWNLKLNNGDPWGQAQAIANSGADIVALQEVETWTEDQPAMYAERLRQLTGQTWYRAWSGLPPCTGGCQGTLILSKLPILDMSTVTLAGMSTARVVVDVGGVRINVFSLHLEYYNRDLRWTQLVSFMEWARSFSGPKLVGGDFNSWWGEPWIIQMETEYTDTWQDVTGSDENGYTLNGTVRFDFLFRSRDQSWRLTPTACWTQWHSSSDHILVVADYNVQ